LKANVNILVLLNLIVPGNWHCHAICRQNIVLIYRRDLYLLSRKPQGNTALDSVIVLYMPAKRQDLIKKNENKNKTQNTKRKKPQMLILARDRR